MLLTLLLSAALAWTPANTTVTSQDGQLVVSGQTSQAMHTHGGTPAGLGAARFVVKHSGSEPVQISVDKVVFLTGHSCDEAPATEHSEPVFGGLFVHGMRESAKQAVLKPGSTSLSVGFQRVPAYYTHCDRFAFAVSFRVGEEVLTVVAETEITREEPLRE